MSDPGFIADPLLIVDRIPTDYGDLVVFRHRNRCATRLRALLATAEDDEIFRILRDEGIPVPPSRESETASRFRSAPVEPAVTPITYPIFRSRE